eukprot:XP_016657224.1 PREDICTED: uncharacterized protein LOC107882805 [Acyrthosiphon pisum]
MDFEFSMMNRTSMVLISGAISSSLDKCKIRKLEGKPLLLPLHEQDVGYFKKNGRNLNLTEAHGMVCTKKHRITYAHDPKTDVRFTKCIFNTMVNKQGFPKDEGRKKLWLKACGIGLYLPSYRVCEAHFSNEDFLPNGYLTSIAIPVNIKSKQPELLESANTVFESTSQETLSPEKITIVSTNSICITPKKRCSSVLPDVSSSQKRKRFNPDTIGDLSPSHFNTPRKAKKNLEMVKYKFSQKQTQNVNLKKQVKRLQTKLKTYDDLILQLKSKNFISENASVHLKVIFYFFIS